MIKRHSFLVVNIIMIFLLAPIVINAQTISGVIKDAATNETLFGASVTIKGTVKGTVTDVDGKFSFIAQEPPFTLLISNIGYTSFEYPVKAIDKPLTIKLKSSEIALEGVDIVEDRITEKQKESPLTVEALDAIAIKATSAANFYEGLGQLKGVDLTAASIGFRIINTRGFNSTSPVRSLQIIDGVDNQSPGLNFSLGNFLGSSELDVQKAEIIVGASSAYYGPNAFNGVISMVTKNPFLKPGISASVKIGERNLVDAAVRYAEVFKNKNGVEKFAFKFNVSYMQANDWEADNMDPTTQSPDGKNNFGGYDAVNKYGDEFVNYYDATSKSQQVARPGLKRWYRKGYKESDLVDYNTNNLKVGAAMHYRLQPTTELIYSFNYGTGTTVYQGDNRYSLKGIQFFQNRIEINKKDKFFIRAYATNEDAGRSYDAVFTGLLLQNQTKSDAAWATDYRNFWGGAVPPTSPNYRPGGMTANVKALPDFPTIGPFPTYYYDYDKANAIMDANSDLMNLWHSYARNYADNSNGTPALIPGTQAFKDAFNQITSTPLSKGGTRFVDKSALYHAHGEYKFTPTIMDITVGANYRLYKPNSEGTIFSDSGETVISTYEYGVYAGLEKKLLNEKLKLNVTTRLDKNKNFNFLISPAGSLVYSFNKQNILRISFSSAIRNPTLSDQFLYYKVGRATLLGNLKGYDSLVTIESITDYYSTPLLDPTKLVYFNVDPIRPEKVKSLEIGYRTTLFKNLFVDGSYYYSFYTDFIGYKIGADVTFAAPPLQNSISDIDVYRVAANANSNVNTQGASIGANYYFRKFFSINANYSWNELIKKEDDPIIPAFNTPKHKYNIGVSGRDINTKIPFINNIGFNINYKWVQGFRFEGSPQFTGDVPTYDMLDMQISKYVPKIKSTFKLGASNLLNNKQFQVYGGPRIGRMAYFSILLELDKN